MLTWLELDKQFRELGQPYLRLDYQWGAAGTYYRLAGPITAATQRFEALAQIAGMKLSELPAHALHADIMHRDSPEERWYEALNHYSNAFQHDMPATQHDADGTYRGHIYSGHVQTPISASSVVALKFSVVSAAPLSAIPSDSGEAVIGATLNRWLTGEAQKRGMLWLVGVSLIGLVLAALAL